MTKSEMPHEKTVPETVGKSETMKNQQNKRPIELSGENLAKDINDPAILPIGSTASNKD